MIKLNFSHVKRDFLPNGKFHCEKSEFDRINYQIYIDLFYHTSLVVCCTRVKTKRTDCKHGLHYKIETMMWLWIPLNEQCRYGDLNTTGFLYYHYGMFNGIASMLNDHHMWMYKRTDTHKYTYICSGVVFKTRSLYDHFNAPYSDICCRLNYMPLPC